MQQPPKKDAFAMLMSSSPGRKQQQQQQATSRKKRSAAPTTPATNASRGGQQQKRQRHAQEASQHNDPAADTTNTTSSQQEAPSPAKVDKQTAVEAFKRAFSSGLSSTPAKQQFDYLLVYDFEATTIKTRDLNPIEFIELACCIVDTATASITASYQSFIRPTHHPQLDPFAIELCGIQQHQVDSAPLLADVLGHHHEWLEQQGVLADNVTSVACTWTEWDLKLAMYQECNWRNIQRPPYLCRWVDLKRHFKAKFKTTNKVNLKECVEKAGIKWEGHHHSGIDDATNTARLAIHMMKMGVKFEVTAHSENPPVKQKQQQQQSGAGGVGMGSSQGSNGAGAETGTGSPGGGGGGGGAAAAGGAPRTSMAQRAAERGLRNVFDASGKWLGRCFCGAQSKRRQTKRPGPNHGRAFFSCGRWTITGTGSTPCDFFMWLDDVPAGSQMVSR